MTNYKNIDDLLPDELKDGVARPIEDYLDTPIVITGVRETTGLHGAYMRLVVNLPDDNEHFFLATGASQPFAALQHLSANDAFPVIAQFTKAGNAIVLKGVE